VPHPVIDLMLEQRHRSKMGGTMRLGSYPCILKEGSLAHRLYGVREIAERHRHRWEVNNAYRDALTEHGLTISGLSPDGNLVEIIELDTHPFFIAGQFHPELKSRPQRAHPLFKGLVAAAADVMRARKENKGAATVHPDG
jgi:CTP synthase